MNADRIDYYTNQLRGVPVSDLGRKLREVLRDATKEAKAEENEACAKVLQDNADACGEESIMRHILESQILSIRARRNHG